MIMNKNDAYFVQTVIYNIHLQLAEFYLAFQKSVHLHVLLALMHSTEKSLIIGRRITSSRFPICVLLALSWNTNENPSTDKLSRAINQITSQIQHVLNELYQPLIIWLLKATHKCNNDHTKSGLQMYIPRKLLSSDKVIIDHPKSGMFQGGAPSQASTESPLTERS